jgi:transposase
MVYLATEHYDMRKSINALALVVVDTLGLVPVSPCWFLLYNRARPPENSLLGHERFLAAFPVS